MDAAVDNGMRGKPLSGESLNLRKERRHWSRNEATYRRAKRRLESLIPDAITTLHRLLGSEDDRVALMAAQDLLNRSGLVVPREQRLAVEVQATADAHVAALLQLARAARTGEPVDPAIFGDARTARPMIEQTNIKQTIDLVVDQQTIDNIDANGDPLDVIVERGDES